MALLTSASGSEETTSEVTTRRTHGMLSTGAAAASLPPGPFALALGPGPVFPRGAVAEAAPLVELEAQGRVRVHTCVGYALGASFGIGLFFFMPERSFFFCRS